MSEIEDYKIKTKIDSSLGTGEVINDILTKMYSSALSNVSFGEVYIKVKNIDGVVNTNVFNVSDSLSPEIKKLSKQLKKQVDDEIKKSKEGKIKLKFEVKV
jgi:hypothetical protein